MISWPTCAQPTLNERQPTTTPRPAVPVCCLSCSARSVAAGDHDGRDQTRQLSVKLSLCASGSVTHPEEGKKKKDNVKNQVPRPPLPPGSPPQGERIKMIIRRRNEKCVKRRGWEAIEGGDGAKRGGIERVLGLLLPLFVCPHAMTSE